MTSPGRRTHVKRAKVLRNGNNWSIVWPSNQKIIPNGTGSAAYSNSVRLAEFLSRCIRFPNNEVLRRRKKFKHIANAIRSAYRG